ncbi:MAG: hypothetical protein KC729_20600 [Candidatus Eisenbacteria bacterium]|uniref:Uncharacterized protein n=1 Tax=Eiseniibacteriota bacterium TaxID=2212470 RepID=A0A956M2P6_UNCEI|nr:hypothetical protein [Candidatus Eisenbacteria bacterium]
MTADLSRFARGRRRSSGNSAVRISISFTGRAPSYGAIAGVVATMTIVCSAFSAPEDLPDHLRDRGHGVPASIFGTYLAPGELAIYPYAAYFRDHDLEYNPHKLGYDENREHRGRYRASAMQLWIGYGVSSRLAVEVETALIDATLDKASDDHSQLPDRLHQSGFTDLEGQVRLRVLEEAMHRPELFAFAEITAPSQRRKRLIGDREWDLKPGLGVARGFSWGTFTVKSSVEYTRDDSSLNIGETTLEYLRRLTPSIRLFAGIEGGEGGAPDEWELDTGIQVRASRSIFVKVDNAVALSSKAMDWAPSAGLMFRFDTTGR